MSGNRGNGMARDRVDQILPGQGGSDYERYLRTDELLSLQKTADEWVHRDELLFQTVHQSSELWLKLATQEVETATAHVREGRLDRAVRLLRRAVHCLRVVTDQLHVLEHVCPWEYHVLRRMLGHGSGFDSPGFRRVAQVSPPLGQAFADLIGQRSLTMTDIYRHGPEDLYQIAELLLEWDERIALWRFTHLQVVERVIGGGTMGTQGTPVTVLASRVGHRYYPELWHARNELTEIANAEAGGPPHLSGGAPESP